MIKTPMFNSPWVSFSRMLEKSSIAYSDEYKVHISINQDQIDKATELVLPILEKYQIHTFKILAKENLKYRQYRNIHGKELVIFMQKETQSLPGAKEDDAHLWINLFNEIENAFLNAGIRPNKQFTPQGDALFPGSHGFIYYRYTNNILDRYVAADCLAKAGLTKNEGFNLTGEKKIENWFDGLSLHSSTKKVNENSIPHQPIEARPVLFTLFFSGKDITLGKEKSERVRKVISDFKSISEYAKELFFGPRGDDYQVGAPYENLAKIFKIVFNIFFTPQYKESSKLDDNKLNILNEKSKDLRIFLEENLECAARYRVFIEERLEKNFSETSISEELADIAPALYFHLYLPIMTAWKAAEQKSEELPLMLEELENLINRNSLVEAIVKCSLHDPKANQLNSEQPIYIGNLTENKINELLINIDETLMKKMSTKDYKKYG